MARIYSRDTLFNRLVREEEWNNACNVYGEKLAEKVCLHLAMSRKHGLRHCETYGTEAKRLANFYIDNKYFASLSESKQTESTPFASRFLIALVLTVLFFVAAYV